MEQPISRQNIIFTIRTNYSLSQRSICKYTICSNGMLCWCIQLLYREKNVCKTGRLTCRLCRYCADCVLCRECALIFENVISLGCPNVYDLFFFAKVFFFFVCKDFLSVLQEITSLHPIVSKMYFLVSFSDFEATFRCGLDSKCRK